MVDARGSDHLLGLLARLVGIGETYPDEAGTQRPVPPETVRAILEGLGLPARTSQDLGHAFDAVSAQGWRQGLPPCAVIRESADGPVIPYILEQHTGARPLTWTVILEDGGEQTGFVTTAAMPTGEVYVRKSRYLTRARLTLPMRLPAGRHRLSVRDDYAAGGESTTTLIVVPQSAHPGAGVSQAWRLWGIDLSLAALRTARGWGIGDFTDLAGAMAGAAGLGADFVSIEPLHAQFPWDPGRYDPFRPSSRFYLDTVFIDVEAVPEFQSGPEIQAIVRSAPFQAKLGALRARDRVDMPAVRVLKDEILTLLFHTFRRAHLEKPGAPDERVRSFRAYQSAGGQALQAFAQFTVLARAAKGSADWRDWPADLRHPDGSGADAREEASQDQIDAVVYGQWIADGQLARARALGREAGLTLGLAMGVAGHAACDGAEAWAAQVIQATSDGTESDQDPSTDRREEGGGVFATGLATGLVSPSGHQAGPILDAPVYHPRRLAQSGYGHYGAMLRSVMTRCDMIRLWDMTAFAPHRAVPAQNVQRAVPAQDPQRAVPAQDPHGAGPAQNVQRAVPAQDPKSAGAVLALPREDLLGVLTLESRQNNCVVSVPLAEWIDPDLIAQMNAMGILPEKALLPEPSLSGGGTVRTGQTLPLETAFTDPAQAMVSLTGALGGTLAGTWSGQDLALSLASTGRSWDDIEAAARAHRTRLRQSLASLGAAGLGGSKPGYDARSECDTAPHQEDLSSTDQPINAMPDAQTGSLLSPPPADALHHALAASAVPLIRVRLEDLLGYDRLFSGVDGPFTVTAPEGGAVPVWSRAQDVFSEPRVRAIAGIIATVRGTQYAGDPAPDQDGPMQGDNG